VANGGRSFCHDYYSGESMHGCAEPIGLKKISHSCELACFNESHASGLSWLVKVSSCHQIPAVEHRAVAMISSYTLDQWMSLFVSPRSEIY
jgi:hypothetical protein